MKYQVKEAINPDLVDLVLDRQMTSQLLEFNFRPKRQEALKVALTNCPDNLLPLVKRLRSLIGIHSLLISGKDQTTELSIFKEDGVEWEELLPDVVHAVHQCLAPDEEMAELERIFLSKEEQDEREKVRKKRDKLSA